MVLPPFINVNNRQQYPTIQLSNLLGYRIIPIVWNLKNKDLVIQKITDIMIRFYFQQFTKLQEFPVK